MKDPAASFAARPQIPEYREFPISAMPPHLGDLVSHAAHDANVPSSFVAVPILGALAGAIGSRYFVTIGQQTAIPMRQPCTFWFGTIGSPSSGKSPGMKVAHDAVDKIEAEQQRKTKAERERAEGDVETWNTRKRDRLDRRKDSQAELKRVTNEEVKLSQIEDEDLREENRKSLADRRKNALDELAKVDKELAEDQRPDDPKVYKFKVDDLTFETLPNRLAENPGGLVAAPPELTALFGSFTRYRSGDSNVGGDMVRYIPFWDGASYTKDRQGNDDSRNVHLKAGVLSIFSTIQPKMFTRVIQGGAKESGFFARWLWVYPPKRYRGWQRDKVSRAEEAVWLLNLMQSIREVDVPEEPRDVSLHPEAEEIWIQYHDRYQMKAFEADSELWEAFFGKVPAQALRLALLLHVANWHSFLHAGDDTDRLLISSQEMADAIELMEWFVFEQERVYHTFMLDEEEVVTSDESVRKAWEWIKRTTGPNGNPKHKGGVSASDLVRAKKFESSEEARGFLAEMVKAKQLVLAPQPAKPRPGPRIDRYLLNQKPPLQGAELQNPGLETESEEE